MVVAVALALVLGVECEFAPWLRDAPGAVRDSADYVIEGEVIGLRYLPLADRADVEVHLEARRSWRAEVPAQLKVKIWDYWECGPTLEFGESYFVGIWEENNGSYALAAVVSRDAGELPAQLGTPLPAANDEEVELEPDRERGLSGLALPLGVMVVVGLLAAFMLGRKSGGRVG